MMQKVLLSLLLMALALAACSSEEGQDEPTAVATDPPPIPTATPEPRLGLVQGMGPGGGMMARHHVSVPEPYAGLTNPVPPDQASQPISPPGWQKYFGINHVLPQTYSPHLALGIGLRRHGPGVVGQVEPVDVEVGVEDLAPTFGDPPLATRCEPGQPWRQGGFTPNRLGIHSFWGAHDARSTDARDARSDTL